MAIEIVAIPGGAATSRKALEDIDPDIKTAVEDAYLYNQDSPGERLEAKFATQDEADEFLRDARAYAYQRETGRLVVSGNTTKKGAARFRVSEYVAPEDGEPENGDTE